MALNNIIAAFVSSIAERPTHRLQRRIAEAGPPPAESMGGFYSRNARADAKKAGHVYRRTLENEAQAQRRSGSGEFPSQRSQGSRQCSRS